MEHIKNILVGALIMFLAFGFVYGLNYFYEHGLNWPLYIFIGVPVIATLWLLGAIARMILK